MLELPEVEVLRKDLEKEIVGKKVKDVIVQSASVVRPFHRNRPDFAKALEGHKIEAVRRRGKVLFIDLDEDDEGTAMTWVVDPGAQGTLHRETATADPGANAELVVTFTIGGAIHMSDEAKDPTSRSGVVPTEGSLEAAGLSADAMDPLDDNPTWMEFGHRLREWGKPLKAVLTDDALMLGLGDVYSDEILWEAGLRWDRQSETLSTQEVRRFYRAMQEVIAAAIKFRGSSLEDAEIDRAVDDEGEVSEHIKVFGRQGMPCYRCRNTLVRHRIRTRTYTHYCEQCQI